MTKKTAKTLKKRGGSRTKEILKERSTSKAFGAGTTLATKIKFAKPGTHTKVIKTHFKNRRK